MQIQVLEKHNTWLLPTLDWESAHHLHAFENLIHIYYFNQQNQQKKRWTMKALNQIHAENIAKDVAILHHQCAWKKTLENAQKNVSLLIEDWGCDKTKTDYKKWLRVTMKVVKF